MGDLADIVRGFLPDADISFDADGGKEDSGNYLVDNSRLLGEFELEYPSLETWVRSIINDVRRDNGPASGLANAELYGFNSPSFRESGNPVSWRACPFAGAFLGIGSALHQHGVSQRGGRLVVIDEVAGPYLLRVGVLPGDPTLGPLHVSILIQDKDGETAVDDATVSVAAVGPGAASQTNAVNSPQNPQLYEGNLYLDALGEWSVTLDIQSSLGEARHVFPVKGEGGTRLQPDVRHSRRGRRADSGLAGGLASPAPPPPQSRAVSGDAGQRRDPTAYSPKHSRSLASYSACV